MQFPHFLTPVIWSGSGRPPRGGTPTRFTVEEGGEYDIVVCSGGDGTLNETLTGLMALEERPPVAICPAAHQ